jgi:hypothetical protein
MLFQRVTEIAQPTDKWVFMQESATSIDDGLLGIDLTVTNAWDSSDNIPSALHNGATTAGFAEGHAELHQWVTTENSTGVLEVNARVTTANADASWIKPKTSQ